MGKFVNNNGKESRIGTLSEGQLYFATDTETLWKGTASGNKRVDNRYKSFVAQLNFNSVFSTVYDELGLSGGSVWDGTNKYYTFTFPDNTFTSNNIYFSLTNVPVWDVFNSNLILGVFSILPISSSVLTLSLLSAADGTPLDIPALVAGSSFGGGVQFEIKVYP